MELPFTGNCSTGGAALRYSSTWRSLALLSEARANLATWETGLASSSLKIAWRSPNSPAVGFSCLSMFNTPVKTF